MCPLVLSLCSKSPGSNKSSRTRHLSFYVRIEFSLPDLNNIFTKNNTRTFSASESFPPSESRYWNFWSFLLITAKHQCISLWIGTNIWVHQQNWGISLPSFWPSKDSKSNEENKEKKERKKEETILPCHTQ